MAVGGIGQRLKLRLFLEGIEVPVIGANIQSNPNAPATASIQVIPTDRILEIKPRTMVHLFHWNYNLDLPQPPDQLDSTDSSDPNHHLKGYEMSFGGEVVGLVMMKTPNGRQAVLQCADWSTYWDTSYQIFVSWSPNGNFLNDRSSVWAGGNSMFDNILSSHSGVMSSYLRRRPKTEGLQDVKGLMGGIISLLEAMGGVPNHVSGVNDFFTIAELKNHLLQQITAEQNDDTAQRLFSGKSFSEWLNRRTTSLGQLVSFRDMLKLLFHWIYYEVIPITSPMFIPAVEPTVTERIAHRRYLTSGLTNTQRKAISELLRTTQRYGGGGGLSLSQIIKNQIHADEKSVARDLVVKIDGVLQEGSNLIPRTKQALLSAKTFLLSVTAVPGKKNFNEDEMVSAIVHANGQTPVGEGGFYTALGAINSNRGQWFLTRKELEKALNAPTSKIRKKAKRKRSKTRPRLDRLQSQVFRPDGFFAAPPQCNVLFPEQYVQFQYQRNFLQEITRLRLSTGLQFISGKGAGLLTPVNFAPSTRDIRELAKKQGNKGLRTLLPWEKFTGILPKFEHISEINYIANKRQRSLQRDVKGQARAYAQRAANFNFLKYRFAPRSMMINAKYSPQFVLGFPALIIDKPFIIDPDAVQQAISEAGVQGVEEFSISDLVANIGPLATFFRAPTQYLGMPASVSHNIDQNTGSTSITLTHARTHRITDDDFLETFLAEVTRKTEVQTKSTVLDADVILRDGDYKALRTLIEATPQNIIEQMQASMSLDSEEVEDYTQLLELDRRPNGAPNLASIGQLAPAIFTTPDPGLFQGSRVRVSSVATAEDFETDTGDTAQFDEAVFNGSKVVGLRGNTVRNFLKGSRTTILEPHPYGSLKPGSKGPLGGKVTQIQLLSDSVLEISSEDIEQFARSSRDRRDARRRNRRSKSKRYYMWRKAVVWEEVKRKRVSRPVPFEEAVRPPWFSPLYSNLFIGEHIYQQFFGTGSIVDQSLFVTPEGAAFTGTSEDREEVLAKVREVDGDSVKIAQILDDYKASSIGQIPSVETAVDTLAFLYGEVKRQGLDVHQFVSTYTSRPIATLKDMLGSIDLEYEIQGNRLTKVSGEAGFHSAAVAPFGDLLGLADNPDLEIARLTPKGKKFPISRALDPRPDRRKRVEEYANEVGGSRGSLGVGLLG